VEWKSNSLTNILIFASIHFVCMGEITLQRVLDTQVFEPHFGYFLLRSRRYCDVKFLKTDYDLKLAHKVNCFR